MNAIKLLKDDHQKVTELFDEFEVNQDKSIADQICMELDIHAQIEEQIFYPAVKQIDPDMIEHGLEEHDEMKQAIKELQAMSSVDEDFKLTMEDLRATVEDHVEEEETELFVEVESKLSQERLVELGEQLMKLKLQLQQGKAARGKSASA